MMLLPSVANEVQHVLWLLWRGGMSLAARIIEYLGGLTLAGGDHDGEPFEVLGWEKRFIRGAFREPVGDSALTVGRGSGKSCLVAGIAAALVDPSGPLHGNRREVVCVASSFDQSRIIYEDVLSFLRERFDLDDRSRWRKQDSANRATLEFRSSGARVRCIGSDPAKAHGLRASLVLADEPAQWDHAKAERMVSALRTGLGKVPGSRLIALGTRASDEQHWFSRALVSAPYSQIHAAPDDAPPFWLRTIRRANPSVDHLPSLKARILAEIVDARRDPDALASFKALRLNMGVADTDRQVLIDSAAWSDAEALEGRRSGPYVLGVDLGQNAAMSAAAAYWRGGDLEAVAVFPELPGLAERGLADGVGGLYQRMAERGELLQAGRRVSDIPSLLAVVLERWGRPAAVICDRWREAELRQHLEALRFPSVPLVVRGMGFKDGSEDVRGFRRAVLGGHVRPSESLLLRSALSEARVQVDPAGNAKLAKGSQGGRRQNARDDAAAMLAVGAGFREWHQTTQPTRRARYRSAVVG